MHIGNYNIAFHFSLFPILQKEGVGRYQLSKKGEIIQYDIILLGLGRKGAPFMTQASRKESFNISSSKRKESVNFHWYN